MDNTIRLIEPVSREDTAMRRPAVNKLRRQLLRAVDLGIAAVLFLAPLFMGGRHPLGRLVYITIVCAAAAAWAVHSSLAPEFHWRRSGAEWLLLAGLLLVVAQLAPLPQSWLASLSPSSAELLPLWSGQADPTGRPGNSSLSQNMLGAGLPTPPQPPTEGLPERFGMGSWSQVSLAPQAAMAGLTMYLAHALLFLVVVQRLQELDDIERLLRWLALAATAMAVLGLVQFLAGNEKFLWVYEHPSRTAKGVVKGAFANENHFAQFLAMGVAPLVWWLQSALRTPAERSSHRLLAAGRRRDSAEIRRLAVGVALGVVCFAALMSLSCGGVIVLVVASLTSVGLLAKSSLLSKKSVCALVGAAIFVGAALAVYGYKPLAQQMERLRVSSARELNQSLGREKIWAANKKAIPRFAVLGAGIGSHREVYPIYLSQPCPVEYTHAESGYLQSLLEGGVPGLLLLLIGIGMCARWCAGALVRRQSGPVTACAVAVSGGLAASAVHSVWDFVWYIPACMSLAVVLAACACRLNHLAAAPIGPERRLVVLPRWAAAAVAVVGLGLGAAMIHRAIPPALAAPHWERYLKLSLRAEGIEPLSPAYAQTVGLMTEHLEQALRRDPDDARANLRMAAMQLRRFDLLQRSAKNPMGLSQIRDAALASRFPSREAQDRWLAVAVGQHRKHLDLALFHARRALKLCPLQGEGYVYLAELAFLDGPAASAKAAYIDQALRVRPHSGEVLLAAGAEAALAGDTAKALDFWKRAFHQGPEYQLRLVELLAPQAPASFFLAGFHPDLGGMRLLFRHYQQMGRAEDLRTLGPPLAQMLERDARAETGQTAADLWAEAAWVRRGLGDSAGAIACAARVVQSAPRDYAAHRLLATWLSEDQQYADAAEQLHWCLHRKPNDEQLIAELATANRKRLEPAPPRR